MTFQSYKPYKKRNLLPKFTIVFLLGMSFALFFSNAFTIVTGIENATQYIKQIVLTSNGTTSGVTGIFLDGTNGNINLNNPTAMVSINMTGNSNRIFAAPTLGIISPEGINIDMYNNNPSSGTAGLVIKKDSPSAKSVYISSNENGSIGLLQDIGNASEYHRYLISGSGEHHWYTSNIGFSAIERMTIKENGNVGIGTTNPQEALDVSGNVTISGTGTLSTLIASKGTFTANIKVPGWSAAPGANSCTSDGVGAIRYDGGLMELCVCDGSLRKKVYSGSLVCVPLGGGGGT